MPLLLDDNSRRSKVDAGEAWRALSFLPAQAKQAWTEASKIKVPSITGIKRIVVMGMGGSALGPHVIQSVYRAALPVPFEVVNGYELPGGVDEKTLVLLSSYSGGTEETLTAAAAAKKRHAKIVGICAGGKLGTMLRAAKAPAYIFEPTANPGNRPRFALGYSIFGILGLLSKMNALRGIETHVTGAIKTLEKTIARVGAEVPTAENPAKQWAEKLSQVAPIYIAAGHLEGSAHVAANQTNETGKRFATWYALPELNHHLMEGLKHPIALKKNLAFVFLTSKRYHPRVQKRVPLTRDVVEKNGIQTHEYAVEEASALAEASHLLAFSGALTYSLGIMHLEDPSPTPWVDYFKENLG